MTERTRSALRVLVWSSIGYALSIYALYTLAMDLSWKLLIIGVFFLFCAMDENKYFRDKYHG